MRTLFFASLMLVAASAATMAQTAPAKTRVEAHGSTAKTRTAPPAGAMASARPVPTPSASKVDERTNALTENMRQALGLTPQQTEKVRNINLNSVHSVETARLQYRTDLRKLNTVVASISESRLAALKDVLTAQQFERYQRKREEKMGIPQVTGSQGNPVPGLPGGD